MRQLSHLFLIVATTLLTLLYVSCEPTDDNITGDDLTNNQDQDNELDDELGDDDSDDQTPDDQIPDEPAIIYTVTFETNRDVTIEAIEVEENQCVSKPSDPTISTNEIFTAWYCDSELNELFDFESPITEDITLYAKWIESANVIFKSDSNNEIYTVKTGVGYTVVKPENPADNNGEQFAGWFYDVEATQHFNFETIITEQITLYAKWVTGYTAIISTKEELAALCNSLDDISVKALLADNIDLSDVEWTPIGNEDLYFKGSFDGAGFTISNLTINMDGAYYLALFGCISECTISNVIVKNPYVRGGSYIGAICGRAYSQCYIENCYVEGGSINTTNSYSNNIAGVVGSLSHYSTVTSCYNSSSINGSYQAGGIVGFATNSSIIKCYNTGDINGLIAGGVVGYVQTPSDGNVIMLCYNTGDVTGTIMVGGVTAGYDKYSQGNDNSFLSCYNSGKVNGEADKSVGGVIGFNDYGIIDASYYIDHIDDQATSGIYLNEYGSYNSDMTLSSVEELNTKVEAMNEAANQYLETTGVAYYTVGTPSSTHLPSLMGENIEF